MFSKKPPTVVISEPDIQAALVHLRSCPHQPRAPVAWDRQHILNLVRESISANVKVGDTLRIGSGLFGIIMPFGIDLAGGPIGGGKLQVWIAVRSAGTDPTNICEI